jgi:hypothetical protein
VAVARMMVHYKLSLKGLRLFGAFMGVFWLVAIVLTATGNLSTYRKDSVLAAFALGALVTAGNLAYRYWQIKNRES